VTAVRAILAGVSGDPWSPTFVPPVTGADSMATTRSRAVHSLRRWSHGLATHGVMTAHGAEQGLLVAWGGLTKPARDAL
jgi:hypothetical protein